MRLLVCRLVVCLLACLSHASVAADGDGIERLHVLIPGSAGGGWDRTARGVGLALTESGLVRQLRYENMSGGGGGKAIAHLIEAGRTDMLMVNSTPIVVRSLRGVFTQSFRDLTPIASVIGDYSTIVVRTESELDTLAEFALNLARAPRDMAIAGGSVPGGTDHIFAAYFAKTAGIPPSSIKYIPYDTGGKAMVGLLSGEVAALSSGFGEVVDLWQQGWVRILCIASDARIAQAPEVPTCREAIGTAPESPLEFVNWRGFFATPGLPAPLATRYRDVLQRMFATEAWTEIRDRNGWVEIYHPGDEFTRMLERQEDTLRALMTELGML